MFPMFFNHFGQGFDGEMVQFWWKFTSFGPILMEKSMFWSSFIGKNDVFGEKMDVFAGEMTILVQFLGVFVEKWEFVMEK